MNSFVLLKQKGAFKRIKIQITFKDMNEVLKITPINKNNLSKPTSVKKKLWWSCKQCITFLQLLINFCYCRTANQIRRLKQAYLTCVRWVGKHCLKKLLSELSKRPNINQYRWFLQNTWSGPYQKVIPFGLQTLSTDVLSKKILNLTDLHHLKTKLVEKLKI